MTVTEVLVVGAGVVGLTTAVTLVEDGHRVTVIAKDVPGRTSLAAGASWGPYHVQPLAKVRGWSALTLEVLTGLAQNAATGVRLVAGIEASRTTTSMPDWAMLLPHVHQVEPSALAAGFRTAWQYVVPAVNMSRYLTYLINRFRRAGGSIVQRQIAALDDLDGVAPVVVNCSGIGATQLVPDPDLYPIRGQLVVVRNPGITTFFSEDTGDSQELTHYLPLGDTVVLGGIARPGDLESSPDLAAAEAIRARCTAVEPQLRRAEVLEIRVGHRPTRPSVRVEADPTPSKLVIHNYGHGGAGVSLSWGCAATVLDLIASNLDGG
jgi:D-amino-acid oxidase